MTRLLIDEFVFGSFGASFDVFPALILFGFGSGFWLIGLKVGSRFRRWFLFHCLCRLFTVFTARSDCFAVSFTPLVSDATPDFAFACGGWLWRAGL